MIIGICGKSGSGKSTLSKQIVEYTNGNAVTLEIDKVGHQVLLLPEVINDLFIAFGNEVLYNNKINRKKLAKIVFEDKTKMNLLTDITWKYMQIEIDKFLELNKNKVVILDWLLLPKSKYFQMCDIRILLDVPHEVRKQRAMVRDNITEEAFDLREKATIEYNPKDFNLVIEEINKEKIRKLVKSL